ncbi:MAG: endonuclease/exonuclease/phosphatase family protein, partial [Bacteroidales bacterium]|nr:endonuclease/exonuclease/phosphatase family protein [Bacteroidales bacterium]
YSEFMRKFTAILAAFLLMLPFISSAADKQEKDYDLKVISYNIRMGAAKDGTNSWEFRYPATALMIEDQKPDVFGLQEAFSYQVRFIAENFKDYDNVGVGRDNGKDKGEFMSIFWNKKTVKMVKWGTFWLSETPEKPSMGWDAACKRTATWALMKDKRTGKMFYFVNTHLDHKGKEAQRKGLELIVSRIDEINPKGYPMILTGDFNIKPDNVALKGLEEKMQSARKIAPKTDNAATFNNWGKAKSDMVIDYIYVSGFSACPEYHTINEKYGDWKYISDHYPIYAKLIF